MSEATHRLTVGMDLSDCSEEEIEDAVEAFEEDSDFQDVELEEVI